MIHKKSLAKSTTNVLFIAKKIYIAFFMSFLIPQVTGEERQHIFTHFFTESVQLSSVFTQSPTQLIDHTKSDLCLCVSKQWVVLRENLIMFVLECNLEESAATHALSGNRFHFVL